MAGNGVPAAAPDPGVPVSEAVQELIGRNLEDVPELSVRSRNSLQKENIRTLMELIQKSREEMLDIDNFGAKSLKKIEEFLQGHGLGFGMKIATGDDGRVFIADDGAEATAGANGE